MESYIFAKNTVPAVGSFIARFIDFLRENNFLAFNRLHIIGHSLGAHVAGKFAFVTDKFRKC
jgi:pimeloyl-ACP methyl ester carboxylesterase